MTPISARSERITIAQGELAAHVALPASGSGPGMLLLHEIFGVNVYVRDSAQRLAELGYVVLAPDLYWRTQPGLELDHDDAGLEAGMAAAQKLDIGVAVGDAVAALDVLRSMPEVRDRRAGVIGFCLGGTLAYGVAADGDPDVAVVYYGSGVPDALDAAARITCPTIMHWAAPTRSSHESRSTRSPRWPPGATTSSATCTTTQATRSTTTTRTSTCPRRVPRPGSSPRRSSRASFRSPARSPRTVRRGCDAAARCHRSSLARRPCDSASWRTSRRSRG